MTMKELLTALKGLGLPEESLPKAELILRTFLEQERQKWGVDKLKRENVILKKRLNIPKCFSKPRGGEFESSCKSFCQFYSECYSSAGAKGNEGASQSA